MTRAEDEPWVGLPPEGTLIPAQLLVESTGRLCDAAWSGGWTRGGYSGCDPAALALAIDMLLADKVRPFVLVVYTGRDGLGDEYPAWTDYVDRAQDLIWRVAGVRQEMGR